MANRQLGMNLAHLTHYGLERPWINALMVAQNWLEANNSSGAFVRLDLSNPRPDGYPASLPAGVGAWTTFWRNPGDHEVGDYRLTWDGDGSVEIDYRGRGWEGGPWKAGGYIFPVDQSSSFNLRIRTTNPANPVRNMRFSHVRYDQRPGDSWHPDWLARNQALQYKVIRTMDWQMTNDAEILNWSNIRPENFWTQCDDWQDNYATPLRIGVSPKWIVEAQRALNCSAVWVCIPYKATDDYVYQLASYLAQNLNDGIECWVEYSNETWNPGFKAFQYCINEGVRLNLEGPDQYYKGNQFYGMRSAQCHAIFRTAFDDLLRPVTDVKRVFGIQHDGTEEACYYRCIWRPFTAPTKYPGEFLSSALYFGIFSLHEMGLNWLQTATFDQWRDRILARDFGVGGQYRDRMFGEPTGTIPWRVMGIKGWTDHVLGVLGFAEHVAYEGGQHLAFSDQAYASIWPRILAFQNSSQMRELYDKLVNDGDTFAKYWGLVHFDSGSTWGNGQYGCWSPYRYHYDGLGNDVKYQSLLTFVSGSGDWKGAVTSTPDVEGDVTVLRNLASAVTCTPTIIGQPALSLQAAINIVVIVSGDLRTGPAGSYKYVGTNRIAGHPELYELSGVSRGILNPTVLWTHKDSVGSNVSWPAEIHATEDDGTYIGKWALQGVNVYDLEDIAIWNHGGTSYIYIGDIGNSSSRRTVKAYRFPEPTATPGNHIISSGIETLSLRWPDALFPIVPNCEAMYVDGTYIYLIAMNQSGAGALCRANIAAAINPGATLVQVDLLNIPLASGADYNVAGFRAIRDPLYVYVWDPSATQPVKVTLQKVDGSGNAIEWQGEAVALDADGEGFVTISEVEPGSGLEPPINRYDRVGGSHELRGRIECQPDISATISIVRTLQGSVISTPVIRGRLGGQVIQTNYVFAYGVGDVTDAVNVVILPPGISIDVGAITATASASRPFVRVTDFVTYTSPASGASAATTVTLTAVYVRFDVQPVIGAATASRPRLSIGEIGTTAQPVSGIGTLSTVTPSVGGTEITVERAYGHATASTPGVRIGREGGTMTGPKPRGFVGAVHDYSAPLAQGQMVYSGAALGWTSSVARALVIGDDFLGFATESIVDDLADPDVTYAYGGICQIKVDGATGWDDVGRRVFAWSDDEFSFEDSGSPIGTVVSVARAPVLYVVFEGFAWRSI